MPVPLTRAASTRAAKPLPDPFPALAESKYEVRFRQGELVMLAGPPGAGKTMVAIVAAVKMGVPALYFSADSNESVMAARVAAAITGHPTRDIERTLSHGLFTEEYGPLLETLPLRFVFDPSEPSITDIAAAYQAWMELWGTPPKLIIVDNLMNMRGEDGNEWQAMRQSCKDLQYFARKTRACVVVLHHTSEGEGGNIQQAPGRPAIQGKVSQLPALIVTIGNNNGEMTMAVVKHRQGAADPLAKNPLRMMVDFATCTIHDKGMDGRIQYVNN